MLNHVLSVVCSLCRVGRTRGRSAAVGLVRPILQDLYKNPLHPTNFLQQTLLPTVLSVSFVLSQNHTPNLPLLHTIIPSTMFAKLAIYTTAVFSVLAVATPVARDGGSCSTGPIQCCQSVESADSAAGSLLLGLLGVVVQGVDVLLGLNCSPITVIGVGSGSSWYEQFLISYAQHN